MKSVPLMLVSALHHAIFWFSNGKQMPISKDLNSDIMGRNFNTQKYNFFKIIEFLSLHLYYPGFPRKTEPIKYRIIKEIY
jgi:hypothetical protein